MKTFPKGDWGGVWFPINIHIFPLKRWNQALCCVRPQHSAVVYWRYVPDAHCLLCLQRQVCGSSSEIRWTWVPAVLTCLTFCLRDLRQLGSHPCSQGDSNKTVRSCFSPAQSLSGGFPPQSELKPVSFHWPSRPYMTHRMLRNLSDFISDPLFPASPHSRHTRCSFWNSLGPLLCQLLHHMFCILKAFLPNSLTAHFLTFFQVSSQRPPSQGGPS